MLVPMRRVDVVATRSAAGRSLRAIHRAGVLHLLPFDGADAEGTLFRVHGTVLEDRAFQAAQERLTELAGLLGPPWSTGLAASTPPLTGHGAPSGRSAPQSPAERVASPAVSAEAVRSLWELADADLLARTEALADVEAQARDLTAERVRLTAEIARLEGYRRLMDGLAGMLGRLPRVHGYASTGIVVARRYRPVLTLVRDELERLTGGRCEVIAADLDQERVAAILLYPARQATEIAALLGGRDLEEVSLPDELVGVPLDELVPRLAGELDRLRARLAATDVALAGLAREHGPTVAALGIVLADRRAELDALAAAGGTDHLVLLSGWVPVDRVGDLRAALEREAGPEVHVIERPGLRRERDAPIALRNGPLLRAFEPLASFVAVPRYGTLDPTPLLGLTLPAFIGLMISDAGYGLVMLAVLVLARRRWPDARVLRLVWPIGLASTSATIAFGILFGEWFGETGRHFGLTPLWFDRRENIPALLALATSIGVAQIALGLILGIVNARRLGHGRELAGRAALLTGLASLLILLLAAIGAVPGEMAFVAGSALLLATVVLLLTMGIVGPIDLLGVVGSVLSYARLMAIGLAGVMLALVADRLGGLIPNLVAGLLVAGVLHALNLVLGVFDASIQGLRLHYVEFFTKFVEPGGSRYTPFRWVLADQPDAARALATGGT